MCGGSKPKVDTSYQDWSVGEAKKARAEEEARQNRISYGMDQIRAIFEGGTTKGSPVAAKGGYDPKATYYNADGSVWKPEAQKTTTTRVAAPGKVQPGPTAGLPKPAPRLAPSAIPKPPAKAATPKLPAGYAQPQKPLKTSIGKPVGYVGAKTPLKLPTEGMRLPETRTAYHNPEKPGQVGTTYKNVTKTTGLTAAEQFAKSMKDLLMGGKGKTYGGVQPILDARREAQEGFYLPQLDEQRDDAQEQLVYALSRAGLGVSTTANKRRVKVDEGFNRERAGVMADIDRDIAGAAGDYENQRQSLESQLRASGDATQATNAAMRGLATFAKDTPELKPLENALLGLTTGIGGIKNAYDVGDIRRRSQGSTVNRDLSKVVGG